MGMRFRPAACWWLVGLFPTKPPHVLRCFFRAVCPVFLIFCFLADAHRSGNAASIWAVSPRS